MTWGFAYFVALVYSPWFECFVIFFTRKSLYFFITCYLILYFLIYFFSTGNLGSYYLNYLGFIKFFKNYKINLLYIYKLLYRYIKLTCYFVKTPFLSFFNILKNISSKLVFWKPLFRKISYFGFFISTKMKWLSKNFNKKF